MDAVAASLPTTLDWANTAEPPTLEALRGRVVLLYFWCFDSANCRIALDEVHRLGSRFTDGLAVLGVHVPRYAHQQAGEIVSQAANRFGLTYPVANDVEYILWRRFGLRAWPSAVLLDVEGRPVATFTGEGCGAEIARRITILLDEAVRRDLRVFEAAVPLLASAPRLPLAFPTRVLATDSHLYIADTGHHRVIEATHSGRILRQFGSGEAALRDGRESEASFAAPQGLALTGDVLYVADTGNHALRRVRLGDGEVDTIAGSGHLGRDRPDYHPEPTAVSMCLPTDLAIVGEQLFVVVSGQNQVWKLDLQRRRIGVFAGTGKFGREDGEAAYASFAGPTGIAAFGLQLIVADAGADAIRLVRVTDGRVSTVAGGGPFDAGDIDGRGADVRLQHPLCVTVDSRGLVFVADSYNHRIKAVNVRSGDVRSMNLAWTFVQPEGISVGADALWVANTNAHEIIRIDLADGECRRIPVGE